MLQPLVWRLIGALSVTYLSVEHQRVQLCPGTTRGGGLGAWRTEEGAGGKPSMLAKRQPVRKA